jgi:hypothetical protein
MRLINFKFERVLLMEVVWRDLNAHREVAETINSPN